MLDVLIRNGWVADGTGSPPFLGDVAIEGGAIVEVGRLGAGATATRVVDASGKVVCPGFVDPHSHSDFSLLANPTAESTIRQGVTTEVVGNCGWSYAPVSDHSREYMSGRLHTFGFDGPVIPWTTFGDHLDFLSDVGHTPNLAWFVGHNSIRLAAGVSGSHPTEPQAALMDRFMREAMEAGALGMSTGLEFNPGREATTAELVRLNAIAGEYDGIYTSHVRNRDSGILHAIAEFLEVARAGGIRAEISHLNVRHNTGAPDRGWERAVEMMAGRARGGHGRARRHDAVPRRARPALRDPAAVGRRRRQGGSARPPPRPRDAASACGPSATGTGGSSTRASGIACACRRASSIPSGTASRSPRSPTSARPIRGTATSTCWPTPATRTRASSSSGGSSPTSTWRR